MSGSSKKRDSILKAAQQAFIREGYESSSMDRIAESAGASKRTVYNHFPSKENLFRAVMAGFQEEVYAVKRINYDPKRSLESQLGEFANAKMEFATNPTWLGMMKVSTGIFFTHPELGKEIAEQFASGEDTLVSWLEAAHKDGRLKIENSALAANIFWTMVSGAFLWPSIFLGPMSKKAAQETKKELINMFLARYKV